MSTNDAIFWIGIAIVGILSLLILLSACTVITYFVIKYIRKKRKKYHYGYLIEKKNKREGSVEEEGEDMNHPLNPSRETSTSFLGLSTSSNVSENDLLNVRIYLRSTRFTLEKPVLEIGRTNKQYFLLNDPNHSDKILMTVIDQSHDHYTKNTSFPCIITTEKEKITFIKYMKKLKHPYIYPIVDIDFNVSQTRATIFRKFAPLGSLRDLIYKTKPLYAHSRKYKVGKPLELDIISLYGRQILEGLKALKSIGLRYPQLASSNIMLVAVSQKSKGQQFIECQLSEVENCFLGVPAQYQYYMSPLNQTVEEEVLCFGHVLYEMASGKELEASDLSQINSLKSDIPCDGTVYEILQRIFNSSNKAVTVQNLLDDPFFKQSEQLISTLTVNKPLKKVPNELNDLFDKLQNLITSNVGHTSVRTIRKPKSGSN